MITDLILSFFLSLVGTIWSFIPSWTSTVDQSRITGFKDKLGLVNMFVPVNEAGTCIGLIATLFAAVIGFKFAIKVVDWIRG